MKEWEKEAVEGVIRNAYLNAELEATCLRGGGTPLPPHPLIEMVRNMLKIKIGPAPDFKVKGPHAERYRKEITDRQQTVSSTE